MKRRKKIVLALSALVVAIITGILLLGQTTPQTPAAETHDQGTPLDQIPDIEIPKNLFPLPEVPYGTIAMLLAMLSALLIAQRRSKKRSPQT